MAITETVIMCFVCFIQATEYGAADSFLPVCLWALAEDGLLCANDGVLVPLLRRMRANVLKRGLLRITSSSVVDLAAASLAFARAGRIDWAAHDSFGWFLYDFADTTLIFVPK